ncbi:MAG: T9SS type A sorting domain-containing protein [Saprospiraceae bacterium]|nr:T9SS type A sorting domain-containing protein [Candidatus Brachybacter algidus]MBP7540683.1 T9SS type A sorting domain-containing protein [Saprospiraceae bacterium]
MNNSPMENGCTDSLVLNEYKITDGLNVICFPNPFGSELKIHAEFPNSNYIIFDAIGRVVFKQNNLTDKLIINTSSWSAGVYYIQINSGKDLIKTVKIIKN